MSSGPPATRAQAGALMGPASILREGIAGGVCDWTSHEQLAGPVASPRSPRHQRTAHRVLPSGTAPDRHLRPRRTTTDPIVVAAPAPRSRGLGARARLGVHATVAGVLLGFAVPVIRSQAAGGPDAGPGLAEHFEHRIRPISAGFAVPAFAFFAAGVTVGGLSGLVDSLTDRVAIGIVAGLVVGKMLRRFRHGLARHPLHPACLARINRLMAGWTLGAGSSRPDVPHSLPRSALASSSRRGRVVTRMPCRSPRVGHVGTGESPS